MVKRLLAILNREIHGLHEAAYLLGFFAILSQVMALLRDRLFANYFGASNTLDIYYAAFRIPDFIFVTVASLVAVSVLVPFIVKAKESGGDQAKKLVDSIFSFFFLLMILVSILAYLLMPQIVGLVFPGFDPDSLNSLVEISRLLLLSPILLGVSNFFGSITQASSRFFVYALSPLLYNLGIIFGIIYFYPIFGITGLGFGVCLGAFLHMAIQFPSVKQEGLIPNLSFKIDWTKIAWVAKVSVPRTVALGVGQLVIIYFLSLASKFGDGSISIFNFAWNLQSVPLSIIGVSYSLAAFPALSKLFATGREKKFSEQLLSAARHILFWSIPISIFFIVLRAQIVRTILGVGEFTWQDTRLTAAALALFVVSVSAQSLVLLLVRAYYAIGDTKTPLTINLFSALLTIALSAGTLWLFNQFATFRYFLESLLRIDDLSGSAVIILPLAYSVGMFLNAFGLWLRLQFIGKTEHVLGRSFFQSFASSVIMGFVAYLGLNVFDDFFDLNTFNGIFFQGLISGLLGILAFIATLFLLGNNEIKEVSQTLHRRFWKSSVVGPEPTEL